MNQVNVIDIEISLLFLLGYHSYSIFPTLLVSTNMLNLENKKDFTLNVFFTKKKNTAQFKTKNFVEKLSEINHVKDSLGNCSQILLASRSFVLSFEYSKCREIKGSSMLRC